MSDSTSSAVNKKTYLEDSAKKPTKFALFFIGMSLLCVITFFISVSVGSVSIPFQNIIETITGKENDFSGILMDIRIPRVVLSIFIGASLSVSGVLLQAVMQNPLADPGVTGISSGASVVVMIILLYMPQLSGSIPFFGFIGSAIACVLIYFLAWNNGITAIRIILAGVAVNAILGGINGMISILNSEQLAGVLSWMNGSLSGNSWNQVTLCMIYTVVGFIPAFALYQNCNILALGDKTAKSLGFNPNMQRILISGVAVFLAGIATSFAGIISFIGLMVPHICRLLIGSNHKYLLPFSAITGACVLMIADTLGRTIASPYEIPVGIVMSVLGAPFFLYLLRKGGKNYGS